MGTNITLSIGGIDVDYAKNMSGNNHGVLYCESNRRRAHCDQLDYDACEPDDPIVADCEMAFIRPLIEVIPRLEIIGFNLDHVAHEYSLACKQFLYDFSELNPDTEQPTLLSFAEFRQFIVDHPIESLDEGFIEY